MPQIDAPKIASDIDFFCSMKLKTSVEAHCNMKVFESHLLLAKGIKRKFVILTFFMVIIFSQNMLFKDYFKQIN